MVVICANIPLISEGKTGSKDEPE